MSSASNQDEKLRPAGPWPVTAATVIGFLLLYIPLFVIFVYSFLSPTSASSNGSSELIWTTSWYSKVFEDSELMRSLGLSFWIATSTTALSTIIGTMGGLALERYRFPLRSIFAGLNYTPLVMPELVLGIALLIWFNILHIGLGQFSITLAHITFCTSYVVMTVQTRLKDFDMSFEEAARDLGASPWQVFWRVTFPLILPGILSGALMAFTLSFDDFFISFFTAGVGSDTLPLKIYSMTKYGLSPEINALSSLLLGGTIILIFLAFQFSSTQTALKKG